MQLGKLPFYHRNTPTAGQGGVERRVSGIFYRFGYEREEEDGKIMDGKIISGRRYPHFPSIPLAGGHDRAPLGIGAEGCSSLGAAKLLHLALEGFPV